MILGQSLAAAIMFFIGMFLKDIVFVFQLFLIVLLMIATISCMVLECCFVSFDDHPSLREVLKKSQAKKKLKNIAMGDINKEEGETAPIVPKSPENNDEEEKEGKFAEEHPNLTYGYDEQPVKEPIQAEVVIPGTEITEKQPETNNEDQIEEDPNVENAKLLE